MKSLSMERVIAGVILFSLFTFQQASAKEVNIYLVRHGKTGFVE